HGTPSRPPLVRGNHSDLLSLCAGDLRFRGGSLPHAACGRGMTEPDVALTDYALALECTVFAYLLQRREHALFFGSAAVASLAGGTVHGFFLDARTLGNAVLWRLTLIAIGVAGLGLIFIAAAAQQARIALHPRYFNHNALYHLIQALALWLLFLGLRRLHADAT